jgi:hypothetical protein
VAAAGFFSGSSASGNSNGGGSVLIASANNLNKVANGVTKAAQTTKSLNLNLAWLFILIPFVILTNIARKRYLRKTS